jgi:hypothetical protein
MTTKTPAAGTPVATGVASGSLGTGTAVDDETTLMAVPDAPEAIEQPGAAATPPEVDPAPAPAVAPAGAPAPGVTARRDPYRPIGIALAAILVALAGVAILSSGGDTPAQIGPLPAASATPGNAVAGDEDEGNGDEDGNGGGNGENNGNGNGNGRGNGNGGDNGRGNDD